MKCKDGRLIEIAQEGEWWKVEKQVHKNVSFISRCTNCWIVYREDISTGKQTKLVVKDSWPSISHVEDEYHMWRMSITFLSTSLMKTLMMGEVFPTSITGIGLVQL